MAEISNMEGRLGRLAGLLGEWWLEIYAGDVSELSLKENIIMDAVGRRKFVKMSDLAGLLRLPPTTATSLVDRLVERGLVRRSRFEDERRIVAVSLTEEGQVLLENRKTRIAERMAGLISRLSNEDQTQLVELFERLFGAD